MKKQIAIALVVAGSVMAISAEGRSDNESRGNRSEGRGGRMGQLIDDADIITVTGKIELVNGEEAKLTSKGTTYTIRAPWQELLDLELTDGQTVTFKGVEMQPRMQWDDSEKNLIVTVAVMGDTEVTFDMDHNGRDGRSDRDGRSKGDRSNHSDDEDNKERRGN